jgi:hypothetical protein
MCSIFGFQYLSQPQQTEFVFHGVDPFFSIKWLCCFLEYWWSGVHEILEAAILIRPIATTLVVTALNIIGNCMQKIFYVLLGLFRITLTPEKLCEEHLCNERGKCGSWCCSLLLTLFPPLPLAPAPLPPVSTASYMVQGVFAICIFQ